MGFHQAAKLYQPLFNQFNTQNVWELDKDELAVLSYFGEQGTKKLMPDGDIPWQVILIGGALCVVGITLPRIIVTGQLIALQKQLLEVQKQQNVNYQGSQHSTNGATPHTTEEQNENTYSPREELMAMGTGFGGF